jgi:hypothetical protein
MGGNGLGRAETKLGRTRVISRWTWGNKKKTKRGQGPRCARQLHGRRGHAAHGRGVVLPRDARRHSAERREWVVRGLPVAAAGGIWATAGSWRGGGVLRRSSSVSSSSSLSAATPPDVSALAAAFGPARLATATGGSGHGKRVCQGGQNMATLMEWRGRGKRGRGERSLARHPCGNHAGVVYSGEQWPGKRYGVLRGALGGR